MSGHVEDPDDFFAAGDEAERYVGGAEPAPDGLTLECTDVRNAERLVELHGNDLRFVGTWQKWLAWDGQRWALDEKAAAMSHAKACARVIAEEAETELAAARTALAAIMPHGLKDVRRAVEWGLPPHKAKELVAAAARFKRAETMRRWAQTSQMDQRLRAMLDVAKPALAITHTELDADPMLLNVANGTIDLRTGTLGPHKRENLCTKLAPVSFDPGAPRARFERFMREITLGDAELTTFLQYFLGYCLTGLTREEIFAFWYGTGGNGKSKLAELIMLILGDYACKSMPDLVFRSEKSEKHETELCDLHGRRFVVCNETKQGRVLDDGRIKDLTGSDRIRARRMREDSWEWIPTHKFVLFGQHKPTLKVVDDGFRRRTKLVPFAAKFKGDAIDKTLSVKLFAEASGVLAWLVEGCVKWQANGVPACKAVDVATGDYFREEDTIGQFFDGECVFTPDAKVTRKALHDAYVSWSKDRGDERPVSAKAFAQGVRDRGGVERQVRTEKGPRDGWSGVRQVSQVEADARVQEQPELPGATLGRNTSATRTPQP